MIDGILETLAGDPVMLLFLLWFRKGWALRW